MDFLVDFVDDSNSHFVFYEEINDISIRARILEHVGSQTFAETMSSDRLPQNPKPVDERVENWNEMTEFIRHWKPFRSPPEPIYSKLGDLNIDTIDNAVGAAV